VYFKKTGRRTVSLVLLLANIFWPLQIRIYIAWSLRCVMPSRTVKCQRKIWWGWKD